MRLCLIGIILFCYLCEVSAESSFYAFDWDDNVVNMPVHMKVFNSKTGKIEILSPTLYAPIKNKTPDFQHYSFCEDAFHDYHEDPSGLQNYFKNDIETIINSPTDTWKGPEWDQFVKVLSDPETASQTLIITAREQSPHTIHAGLLHLQEKGLVKYVLPEENIWTVNAPNFHDLVQKRMNITEQLEEDYEAHDPQHDSAKKFFVIKHYLNRLATQENQTAYNSPFMRQRIYDQPIHFWYFSDDTEINILTAEKMIHQNLKTNNNWSHLRLKLHYTNTHKPTARPYTILVSPQSAEK